MCALWSFKWYIVICKISLTYVGVVKKVGAIRLAHELYREKGKTHGNKEQLDFKLEEAYKHNKDLKAHLSKAVDDMNPLKVLILLRMMDPLVLI